MQTDLMMSVTVCAIIFLSISGFVVSMKSPALGGTLIMLAVCIGVLYAISSSVTNYNDDTRLADQVSKEYHMKVNKVNEKSNGVYNIQVVDKDGVVRNDVNATRDKDGNVVLSVNGEALKKD